MKKDCTNVVTHIGEKGYVYCQQHVGSRQGWERCRKLRPWEIDRLKSGKQLQSYKPINLAQAKLLPSW